MFVSVCLYMCMYVSEYFHVKELVLTASRNRSHPHEDYPTVKIFNDLSAATLKKQRAFQQVAEALRQHGTKYRWGYPTKMLIQQGGVFKPVHTREEGIKLLKEWGIPLNPSESAAQPIKKTTREWSVARKRLT
ncbi:Hypothetical predicted protein [Pelobates cultripes]|uniref:Uncharacterized protein n=1 Tax=Pelobates cultripes TaxID=61616 RepID=A0AAD1W1G6_PELCU|nr:Hypothetical predicted protein [Pelobates cultripes]